MDDQLFRTALERCGVRDKMNFRLGEVVALSGMTKNAILKMKESLNAWRPPNYNWDCYPREQVKELLLGTLK